MPLTLPQHRITLKGHAMDTDNILNYNFPFNLKMELFYHLTFTTLSKNWISTFWTSWHWIYWILRYINTTCSRITINSPRYKIFRNQPSNKWRCNTWRQLNHKNKMYYGQISFAGKLIKSWVSSIDNGSTLLGLGFLMSLEGKL